MGILNIPQMMLVNQNWCISLSYTILKLLHIRNLFGIQLNIWKLKHLQHTESQKKYYEATDDAHYKHEEYKPSITTDEMEDMTVLTIIEALRGVRSNTCPFKQFVAESKEDNGDDIGQDCAGDYGRDSEGDAQDGECMRSEDDLLANARIAQSHIDQNAQSSDSDSDEDSYESD
eukprot:503878_1